MTPPVAPTSAPASDRVSPYQLQLSGGYTALELGDGVPSYTGGQFQATVGQSFFVHPNHAFNLSGVFRLAGLSNETGESVNMVHFGLQGGYEFHAVPNIFSLFTFAGIGTNVLHTPDLSIGSGLHRALNNQAMLALSVGGGFTLGRGLLVFSGGVSPNFGLSVPADAEGTPARGYNPMNYFVHAGIDLARIVDWATDASFPRDVPFGDWIRGINPGFTFDSSYVYNFNQPADHVSSLRVFQNRWDRPQLNWTALTLDRPVDAANPFGFRLNFGVGENVIGQRARSSFSGEFASGDGGSFGYDMQEFYARLRLPLGSGLTLRGGKFATPIGNEVLESLSNNHMSHSFQFLYGIPFTHLGMLGEYTIDERVTLTAGLVNGWDNVLDRTTGIAGLGAVNVVWTPEFSTYVSGTVGDEGGRLRSIVDVILRLKPAENLSFALEYDWGHEGDGAGLPTADWHAASLTGRYDFNRYFGLAAGGEVFEDSVGARTGAAQTLYGVRATAHITPLPWMRLRVEGRHDRSTDPSFTAGTGLSDNQTTVGLGAGVVLPNP